MERSISPTKNPIIYDNSGKVNPKSKKLTLLQSNKKFFEDDSKKAPLLQYTPSHPAKPTQNPNRKYQTSQRNKGSLKDHTEKKTPLNQKKPQTEKVTAPRKRRPFKQTQTPEKIQEYVYIYDPKTEYMKKHLVVQGQDINFQLNINEDYMPPNHTCDEDCDSSDQVVRRGVEKSKRDLFAEIQRRKNLQSLIKSNKPAPRALLSDSGQETDDEKETEGSKRAK